jgi:hypothetical protein
LLPIEFDVCEKRPHDYVRHGTTNLFAALDVFPPGYQIRGYIDHWNTDQESCNWTATARARQSSTRTDQH